MEDLSFGHRGGVDPLVILVSPEGTPPFFLSPSPPQENRRTKQFGSFICVSPTLTRVSVALLYHHLACVVMDDKQPTLD